MRKKQVWRYYCDFCGKGGQSGGHMKRHERSCCRNPERKCGMCAAAMNDQEPLPKLIEALGKGDVDGLARLRELATGCPACMLAAIIQSKLQRPLNHDGEGGFHVDFDFKKEKDAFWQTVNANRNEDVRSTIAYP